MAEVVAVRRDEGEDIAFFKLDDGRVLNYTQCIEAIDNGDVIGLTIGADRWGRETIRSHRDNDPTNNLADLPEF